jgi:hypothetical protein
VSPRRLGVHETWLDVMAVAITKLPKIIEILTANNRPQFLVYEYDQFAEFVASCSENNAPNVAAVLDHNNEPVFVVVRWDEFRAYVGRIDICGTVDEEHYRMRHPDVKAAIGRRRLRSATQHYIAHGYFEQREARFPISDGQQVEKKSSLPISLSSFKRWIRRQRVPGVSKRRP